MVSYLKNRFLTRNPTRLSDHLQLLFLKRLSRLLTNGYSLVQALEVIKWDQQLYKIADLITDYLKKGQPIDQAFEKAYFHPTITAYLYFVRTHGHLQSSIEKCVLMFESRLSSVKKFQQIIRYPLILAVIFFILLIVIKQSVLPSFIQLYESHVEASSMILLSVKMINVFITFVIILSVLIVLIIFLWIVYQRHVPIQHQIKLYQAIPIYRSYVTLQTSYQFATHLSSLLKTGMSIKDILQTIAQQHKLPIISHYASKITTKLQKGHDISSLLKNLPLIEPQLAHIFQKNTDMIALEKDLTMYTELVTEDTHQRVMKLMTLIQPIFFVFIASFIIFIYLTLMWPMFQLINTI